MKLSRTSYDCKIIICIMGGKIHNKNVIGHPNTYEGNG